MLLSEADPKGLIRESYRIEGITAEQCRSVFVDWALSLPVGLSLPEAIGALMAEYDASDPDHPMGGVMREGLQMPETPRRRGGRAGRLGES
ncbi:MAG: hypothetical protein DI533_01790 [Cereibacter sphaeroides]|uniref:Uncharacterized protein n=1 Tax=Cereibacter sphaeroides TaxID=1063 RepID=A0A2W5SEX9_CERSP|nr:MAG: hypothetical protein DI533_01790 [Cereibacter sphaeroides]